MDNFNSDLTNRLIRLGIDIGRPEIRNLINLYSGEPERIEAAVSTAEHCQRHKKWDDPELLLKEALEGRWKPPLYVPKIPAIRFHRRR